MKRFASALLALLLTLTLVLPNLTGLAWAATAASKKSADDITPRPENYNLFFDSKDEAYSFNTATYWDVYQQDLGVKKGTNQLGTNGDNNGLVLTSSTDGALVPKGASASAEAKTYPATVSLTGIGWGDFSLGYKFEIPNVSLAAGANDINVKIPGGDLRGMYVYSGDTLVASLLPSAENGNVQASLVEDKPGTALTASNKSGGWVEGVGNVRYKRSAECFGYLDNGSVTYHFGIDSGITEGTYTIKVEYAINENTSKDVTLTVGAMASSGLTGALRIDYETASTFIYKQYSSTDANGSDTNFDYSDGSSTVVGWGGDFNKYENAHAKYLVIAMKDVEGPSMDTVLGYLTIHLVDQSGATIDSLKGEKLVETYVGDKSFNADYTTYLYGPINDPTGQNSDVQGLKLMFERGNNQQDISGTVEVAYVGICTQSDYTTATRAQWIDFSPFNYDRATLNGYEENGTRPFLRPNENSDRHTIAATGVTYTDETGKNQKKSAVVSGYNISTISNYDWHAWTMSTSDANIVSEDNADHNGTGSFNALEIKYQNTGSHTTYAKLTGPESRTRSGQWLAITMKAEDLDAMKGVSNEDIGNIRIVLKNGSDVVHTVPLSEFKTACTDDAGQIDLEQLKLGYRTLFYNMQDKATITTVEFDFSNVTAAKAGEDTHRIYVKDIYLFSPTLTIDKAVDKKSAEPGDEITYTLTVKNASSTKYDTSFTVTDNLPAGLTYVDGSAVITGPDGDKWNASFTKGGQELSWTFEQNLEVGKTVTIVFHAKVADDAVDGTVYANTASVGDIYSPSVKTTVENHTQYSKVFYAQVGQKTTLNLDLGQTMVETTVIEPTQVQEEYPITVTRSSGDDGAKGTGSTTVEIPAGAEVRLYGPTDGGFIFSRGSNNEPNAVQIGNQTWNLNRNSDGTYTNFTVSGSVNFHKYDNGDEDGTQCVGPLSSFLSSENYVVLNNVNVSGMQTVTLNLEHMWASTKEFKVVVCYTENVEKPGQQEMRDNTFNSIVDPGENAGFEVTAPEGAVGKRTLSLSYTSNEIGTKVFHVEANVGSETKAVQVTVYNYNVQDHTYVLDYGLPVYLTGKGTQGTQGIADYAGTDLLNGEANDGLHFFGVIQDKQNTDDAADSDDYLHTGYQMASDQGVQFTNGVVTSTFSEVNEAEQSIKYTPTRFMDCADVFYYGVQVQKNGTTPDATLDATNATPVMEGKITVVPASIVYYEDNFSKSGTGADGDNGVQYGGNTSSEGGNDGRMQSNDINLRYGYDKAYENDGTYSGGSATKMEAGSYAMFQFKGTGVDIISSTADNTGTVFVYVFDDAKIGDGGKVQAADGASAPRLVDMQIVNTYYENNGTQGLYQIPVVNVRGLEAGKTHVVKIVVSTVETGADKTAKPVYLDGLRIYNPMADGDQYYVESEKSTKILELRDLILGSGYTVSYDKGGNATLTTEGKDVQASLVRFGTNNTFLSGATVTENFTGAYYNGGNESKDTALTSSMVSYLVQGPNNEVYLTSGYGVAFYVEGSGTLQIAAKKLMGNPNLQYRDKNGNWVALGTGNGGAVNTATEMYYEIPLDLCQTDENGKHLVVLRVGNGVEDSTPTDVMSLTYLKATAAMQFSSVADQVTTTGTTTKLDWSKITTVSDSGRNQRKTITLATNANVIDVKVKVGGQEVTATAASYVFSTTDTKTWVVTYGADQSGDYTVELISATGAANADVN